jgi:Domain of unknown function (DUF3846)
MKAYWINATTKTIETVEWNSTDKLRELVGGWIEINRIWPTGDVLYADEEGLLKGGTTWFRLAGKTNPICGNGILVGPEVPEDDWREWLSNTDPVLTIEQLAAEITFVTPEQVASWAKANSSNVFAAFTDLDTGETTVLGRVGDLFGSKPPERD